MPISSTINFSGFVQVKPPEKSIDMPDAASELEGIIIDKSGTSDFSVESFMGDNDSMIFYTLPFTELSQLSPPSQPEETWFETVEALKTTLSQMAPDKINQWKNNEKAYLSQNGEVNIIA